MYRVAVLDDEKVYLKIFEEFIGEILQQEEIEYQIDVYESAKELEENLGSSYDLFILDILLSDINGINFARKLRSMGEDANIIFVSGNEEYLKSENNIAASQYLLKPIKKPELQEAIARCLVDYFSKKSITIIKDDMEVEIKPEDIYYIEHIYNGIKVQGEIYPICTLDSLEDLFPIVEGREFFRCHKDYIVNLKYVQEIEKYDFKLTDGQVVPITKNMYKTAQKELLEYIK